MYSFLIRIITLAKIFIKEQLKEPIALFWIMASPCAVFYMLILSRGSANVSESSYIDYTAWFYAYVASSVAFFGFSFYIIGRRESGFIRSFVYTQPSRRIFFISHFLAYSLISLMYCSLFYFSTRPLFGAYQFNELGIISSRFYVCYLIFCTPGLLLTALPLNFQSAHTALSVTSFIMLGLGLAGSVRPEPWIITLNTFNPITIATSIMREEVSLPPLLCSTLAFFTAVIIFNIFFRINPVWNRY